MGKYNHISAEYIVKQLLLCIMSAASLMWVLWWLMSSEAPKPGATKYLAQIETHMRSRFLRTDAFYGSVLLYVTVPFIFIAISSFAVVHLRKKLELKAVPTKSSIKGPCMKMTTYPLLVRSPLGVLTAAEAFFIATMLLLISYTFSRATYLRFEKIDIDFKLQPEHFKASLKVTKLGTAAYHMGRTAMIPFCLLWIPVSRGSSFLRLIKMPFEHAVKYHIWLSTLTIFMLALHGIGYIIFYAATHTPSKIVSWESQGEECAVVAGVIALIIGLIMWTTSLSLFRRRWYEVFFGFHHLYMIFFLFFLYHVMWTVHFIAIPCLFFMVDRFLRMVQSRKDVDVLSAKLMESGSLHLKVAAARDANVQGLEHYALSSWYLRVPSLSRLINLQWHFFSVTSTPMDGKSELSFMIKPFGKWTANLKDHLCKSSLVHDISKTLPRCPLSFKVGIEGPYGDETFFFLRYKVLILVAGGIGVTPLLAIVSDILHRQRLRQEDLPQTIHIYHCTKTLVELCTLNSVDPSSIVPEYEKHGLKIHVSAYVTSQMVDGKHANESLSGPAKQDSTKKMILFTSEFHPSGPKPQGVFSISSKGEPLWVACTTVASISGFYIFWGLSNLLFVKTPKSSFPNYNRAHLVLASMMLGTMVFGGIIVLAWQRKLNYVSSLASTSSNESAMERNDTLPTTCTNNESVGKNRTCSPVLHRPILTSAGAVTEKLHEAPKENPSESLSMADKAEAAAIFLDNVTTDRIDIAGISLSAHGSPWNGSIQFGCRPVWNEIFTHLDEYQGQNIGVLVSGPPGMREDVAEQCRKHTRVFGKTATSNVFHYHPISFDL